MAQNYDPILNRLRTFRFNRSDDYETLRQERIQDVLDIEEFRLVHDKVEKATHTSILVTLSLLPFNYFLGHVPAFNSLNPYFRVTARTALLVLPFFIIRFKSKQELEQLYHEILSKKVTQKYEEPLTLKYKHFGA